MTEDAEQPGGAQMLNLQIPEDLFGGVWANFAAVRHSPYEFTIDFCRIDYGNASPEAKIEGRVVARINLSPLFVTQLLAALQTNWDRYAEKAMPPEVRDDSKGQ